jgi:protocatechuate 3,4-dioxygenase beta subunit
MSLTRRDFGRNVLAGIATTAVVGTGACGSSDGGEANGGTGGDGGSGGVDGSGGTTGVGGSGGTNGCTVYPQQTEGPFYIDLDLLRRDITESKAGMPLNVVLQVQSADCAPLKDLAVDLWHCDANGVYSGFPGQLGGVDTSGQKFLRGTQVTDADGIAEFESIYPGWYPGRTTHIHFKVHTSSTMEATSQLYFPEEVTNAIYATSPYDARGPKDTSNTADAIAAANPAPLAVVSGDTSSGFVATIIVTVA